MEKIILTPEQRALIRGTLKPVEILDSQGNIVTIVKPRWTEADLAEADQIMATMTRWYSTAEVFEHLRLLGAEI